MTDEMRHLLELLSDFDGEVTSEQKEKEIDELFARMAEVRDELGNKSDAYVHLIAEFRWMAEGQDAEAKRLKALSGRNTVNADNLEERLKMFLGGLLPADKDGKQVLRTRLHELRIGSVGGKRSMVIAEGLDPNVLPEEVVTVIPEELIPAQVIPEHKVLDKDAALKYLEHNEGNCALCSQPRDKHTDDVPLADKHNFEPPLFGLIKLNPRGRKLTIK